MKKYIITEQQVKAQFDEIQKLLERALEAERFISDLARGWSLFSFKAKKINRFISKLIDSDKIVDFEKLHPKFEEHVERSCPECGSSRILQAKDYTQCRMCWNLWK